MNDEPRDVGTWFSPCVTAYDESGQYTLGVPAQWTTPAGAGARAPDTP
jgi:hypothetical protein